MSPRTIKAIASADWSALRGAYGAARDVPALFSRAIGEDVRERRDAWFDLFGTVWHQGSVYEASVPTVRVMLALLADSSCPERASSAAMIVCLARGAVSGARGGADTVVHEIRRELVDGMDEIVRMLGDVDVDVRRALPEALTAFPEFADRWMPTVAKRLGVETDSAVRGTLWLAAAAAPTTARTLAGAARSSLRCAPAEAVLAAFALSRLDPTTDRDGVAALARSAAWGEPNELILDGLVDVPEELREWIEGASAASRDGGGNAR